MDRGIFEYVGHEFVGFFMKGENNMRCKLLKAVLTAFSISAIILSSGCGKPVKFVATSEYRYCGMDLHREQKYIVQYTDGTDKIKWWTEEEFQNELQACENRRRPVSEY
jgi:hypothetical protein